MAEVKQKTKGQYDQGILRQAKEFTVVFNDGKGLRCRLEGMDAYNLLVWADRTKILIPKHAIKYIILSSNKE